MHLFLKENLWRPFGRFMILVLTLIILSSCGKHKFKNSSTIALDVIPKSELIMTDALVNQAKYSYMPVPIGFDLIDQAENDVYLFENKTDFLAYHGESGIVDLLIFYKKNLERDGWKISDLSNEYEGLLICDKPKKQVVISIRSLEDKKTKLCLFIKNNFEQSLKIGSSVDVINSKPVNDSDFNGFKKG